MHPITIPALVLCATLAAAACSETGADLRQQLERYAADADALVAALDDGEASDTLAPRTQALLDLSLAILPGYLNARPECTDYLTAAAAIATQWSHLTAEQIERDYHRDGALPKSEATAVCYHMKDLIVHPATALALMAQPDVDRAQIRDELHEVAIHARVVAQQP